MVDLTPYWEEYNSTEVVPEGLQSVLRIDGKFYAIPINAAQHNFLWWNKQVFADYPDVPTPPYETWDDFFAAADAFSAQADIPFFVNGLPPPTEVGLGNTTVLAALRYGPDIYRRYANEDYVSTRGMFENQRRVAAGDGALTFQGNWARTAFIEANMELNSDYGRTQFPSPEPIFEYNPSSYIVFANSGNEKAATLIAVSALFPESQKLINKGKGTPPARTEIVTYGTEFLGEATLIPKYDVGFPPEVVSDYSPVIVSYLEGSTSLDDAVNQLMDFQERHSDKFIFSF